MKNFVLADTCEVSINRKDETPVIIFQDLPTDSVNVDGNNKYNSGCRRWSYKRN